MPFINLIYIQVDLYFTNCQYIEKERYLQYFINTIESGIWPLEYLHIVVTSLAIMIT